MRTKKRERESLSAIGGFARLSRCPVSWTTQGDATAMSKLPKRPRAADPVSDEPPASMARAKGKAHKADKAATSGAVIGFEEKLWLAADKLRGSMDPGEYKHVVLGLVFLKYISDAFVERHAEVSKDPDADPEDPTCSAGSTSTSSRSSRRRRLARWRLLHAELGGARAGRDDRADARARLRSVLRLRRHVRPVGESSSRRTAARPVTSRCSARSRTRRRGASRS